MRNLHAALAPDGIYAGTLVITAGIRRSAFDRLARTRGADPTRTTLDPDQLADRLWEMAATRSRAEQFVPEEST